MEQIKHLFSVKNITFLLVTNREQLEESIKTKYGRDIDPTNYLHKFISLWLSLPRKSSEYDDHGSTFLQYAIKSMCSNDEQIHNEESLNTLHQIIKFYKPLYREIERTLSYFAIIHNMSGDSKYYSNYQYMIAFVCYLKACHPKALDNAIYAKDSSELIKEMKLDRVIDENDTYVLHYLKKLVKFDLGTQETKNQMIQEKEIQLDGHRIPSNIVIRISGWLSEIKKIN